MLKKSLKFLFLLPIFVIALAHPALAEDEGLYDAVPPEGSAFVRFIHAEQGASELVPKINGRERDGVKFGGVKPYGVVAHGKVSVEMGSATLDFDTEAKGYYTVILQNGTLRFVKDPALQDELKAQIIVYNLTTRDDITLKTADGKVSVIGPVKAGEVMDRAVNPIKVSFAVYAGDQKYADLSDWPLERQESYVIAVVDDAGTGKAMYDRARLSTE